ncbi:MAG: type II secretion system minor pseudopilin GspJ, partial [Gammaproteobacteria bacterium]
MEIPRYARDDSGVSKHATKGFTLLEILIALFIFTILSMILVSALHNIIGISSRTERNAEQLRKLQMTLLMVSRDVEQTVDRPIINADGKEEEAFIGTPRGFTLTHTGLANPSGLLRSTLQRTGYQWRDQALWRITWPVVDQAPQTKAHERRLLGVEKMSFEYLDKNGRFQPNWPAIGQGQEVLPKAVRVTLTITTWGNLSQLYIIPAQSLKAEMNAPTQKESKEP